MSHPRGFLGLVGRRRWSVLGKMRWVLIVLEREVSDDLLFDEREVYAKSLEFFGSVTIVVCCVTRANL